MGIPYLNSMTLMMSVFKRDLQKFYRECHLKIFLSKRVVFLYFGSFDVLNWSVSTFTRNPRNFSKFLKPGLWFFYCWYRNPVLMRKMNLFVYLFIFESCVSNSEGSRTKRVLLVGGGRA